MISINTKIAFIIILCLPLWVFGQEKAISLQSVIAASGADNLAIRVANHQFAIAEATEKTGREWWMPNLNAGVSLHQRNGAAMNSDGRFFLDISRQNFDAGLGLELNLDLSEGIYKTKSLAAQTNAAKFSANAVRNQKVLETIYTYFDLLAAKEKQAAYTTLSEQSLSVTEQLEVQFNAGLVNKSELLLAQSNSRIDQLAINKAKLEFQALSARMVQHLNLPAETKIMLEESITPLQIISPEDLETGNATDRPEYKSLQENLRATGKMKAGTGKGRLLPTIRLGVYESLFGDIFSPTDIEFQDADALHPSFEFNGMLEWNIPLSELGGGGQKRLYAAREKLLQVKSEEQLLQANSEMQAIKAMLEMAGQHLQLAKESQELASEALAQSLQRQKLRKARAFEVLQVQDHYVDAMVMYIDAVTEYNKAQYSWLFASGKGF